MNKAILRTAVTLLVVYFAGCSRQPDIVTFLKGAPPAPPGYANADEVKKAAISGKVKLIKPPKEMPDSITVTKGVEYGKVGDKALLLDLYVPKETRKPVPALIFIHGGGWKKGSREDYAVYNIDYAVKGYVTASIDYRMIPDALFPAAVEDSKCAVRWIRANAAKYNVDPNKIAVLGGSAGGHLSLMVGYSHDPKLEGDGGNSGVSSAVQAVVNFYGVPDLTGPIAAKSPECTGFIGKSQAEAPELYAAASPITYLTKDAPPTLTFHGTIDELVPVVESEKLHARLTELGVPNAFDKIEGWPHTMDAAQDINKHCQYVIDRFLEKYLPK